MLRRPLRPTLFPYTTLFRSLAINVPDFDLAAAARISDVDLLIIRRKADSIRSAVRATVFVGQLLDLASLDRKSTRLNSSHPSISYAVFCLKKKTTRCMRDQW